MAARVLDGIGAAANETLGPMLVADIFFLHERGLFNGAYFFALFCSGAMGPIIGGYIASSAGGWRVGLSQQPCQTSTDFEITVVFLALCHRSRSSHCHVLLLPSRDEIDRQTIDVGRNVVTPPEGEPVMGGKDCESQLERLETRPNMLYQGLPIKGAKVWPFPEEGPIDI
jgi:hypothetical protein